MMTPPNINYISSMIFCCIFIDMQLGDLAWDYTDAYLDAGGSYASLDRRIVIILEFPEEPSMGRTAKVLTLQCEVKRVPVELLKSVW
jgi:hypothetical protein